MPYFALMYEVVDDFVARRAPFRDEHLRRAGESHARGEIVLAGALADPADAALIIFRCANRSVAEEFARRDPYVANRLVKKWTVRPWTVVVGQQPDPPSPVGGRLQ
ncbi:MAG: YciI-like protein [Candidatus Acidiferrum sp.]